MKIAIVSSDAEFCGIAAYTRALAPQLERIGEVEVLGLDQTVLRSTAPRGRRAGDDAIARLCREATAFDVINLQYEPGTLGATTKDISRRLDMLLAVDRPLVITFHTYLASAKAPVAKAVRDVVQGRLRDSYVRLADHHQHRRLGETLYRRLRDEVAPRGLAGVAHTHREAQRLTVEEGLPNVVHHPLTFLRDETVPARREHLRTSLLAQIGLDADADVRVLGGFGFLAEYKGTLTAVRAMRHLPENHHLVLVGGIHPNSLASGGRVDPYLLELLDEIGRVTDPGLRDDLRSRVHFLGPRSDADFIALMSAVDDVVLPYQEVGQTSSGPVSLAWETGARVHLARTLTFLEFARYDDRGLHWFEVGNDLQLAQGVRRVRDAEPTPPRLRWRANVATYEDAIKRATSTD